MKAGALILAGGKSSRMNGQRKEDILWGNTTFLGLLCHRLWEFKERLISVGKEQKLCVSGWETVPDHTGDQGPLEGLICGLRACRSDVLFVVSCDMPFLPPHLPQRLLDALARSSWDGCICEDKDGHCFPLCGVYKKSVLPVLEQSLASKDLRVMNALSHLKIGTLKLEENLLNLNTPEQVQELFQQIYRLDLEDATARMLSYITEPKEPQEVPLSQCQGRFLSQDYYAPMDNPPFDRSALDGYAFYSQDIAQAAPASPVCLPVDQTIFAGPASPKPLSPGHAVRIMTGAVMPPGADCVVRQEDTDRGSRSVSVYVPVASGKNYAKKGEDIKQGTLLLKAGSRIGPVEMGILASMGADQIPLRPVPRVALLSTGDELMLPGQPLQQGTIYNSSLFVLAAKLTELGAKPAMIQMLKDDPKEASLQIRKIAQEGLADFIITTGGVSVGQKDIIHQTVAMSGGRLIFWRLKIKPGSPVMFWTIEDIPVLSLSGNPFAAFATFELLARPALGKLLGTDQLCLKPKEAVMGSSFRANEGLRRFVRGKFHQGTVTLPEGHSSGMLMSLKGCNCLVDIPSGSPSLRPGDPVHILLDQPENDLI